MVDPVHLNPQVLSNFEGGNTPLLDEDEYLVRHGVGSPISGAMDDKIKSHTLQAANTQYATAGQRRALNQVKQEESAYFDKRSRTRGEYQKLVKAGKVRPRTNPERMFATAQGSSGSKVVQAARRVLTKHGVDWKTGKRIEHFTGRGYPEIDRKTGKEILRR